MGRGETVNFLPEGHQEPWRGTGQGNWLARENVTWLDWKEGKRRATWNPGYGKDESSPTQGWVPESPLREYWSRKI